MSTKQWSISAFYRFFPIGEEELGPLRQKCLAEMERQEIRGLFIVSREGINATVATNGPWLRDFEDFVAELAGGALEVKRSVSDAAPFRRATVVIRPEIVTLKRPDLVPESPCNGHLSPEEWHEHLTSGKAKTLIDTRNDYEVMAGAFQGAIDPGIRTFAEWPAYLSGLGVPKEEPVYLYCTGGIRCEKAVLAMHEAGWQTVYQLQTGILGYLEQFPDGLYKGECYVFDDRIAVDCHLQPSQRFGACVACGLTAEARGTCEWCGGEYFVCPKCEDPKTCGKTCGDRRKRHGSRG